jgi:hypothetical protein
MKFYVQKDLLFPYLLTVKAAQEGLMNLKHLQFFLIPAMGLKH